MKKLTSKQIVILSIFLSSIFFQACATFQPTPLTFTNKIDSLISTDFFKSSQAGIVVYDLTENKQIYNRNEKLLLRPASNEKILTTAAAYYFLGKNYEFETSVYHTGEIQDSVCNGNIHFVGGFDPDFTSNDLEILIDEIKKYGIKKVNGNLFADVSAMDSLYWGSGWMWNDDPDSYAAYLTPLCINKNCIRVVSKPTRIGNPVQIELLPNTNYLQVKNLSIVIDSGKNTFNVTRDWLNKKNVIIATGNLPISTRPDTTELSVLNPAMYFLTLAKESFIKNGISVTGILDTLTLVDTATKIFTFKRSIQDVIRNTNKVSDNLSAEMLLRALALKLSKPASAEKGILLVDSLVTLAGLNPKNYRLIDGSGLSYYNLVSPELLCEVLKFYHKTNLFKELFDSFPISGVDGTLSNRMKSSLAYKKVHAKTGTISGVSSLSGYLETKRNHLLAFSILIQNFVGSASQARKIQDSICEILYNYN